MLFCPKKLFAHYLPLFASLLCGWRSVEDSVELARELQPRRTFLVGLGSDIEYAATNAVLTRREQEDGDPCVRLAYDGLAVDIDLD